MKKQTEKKAIYVPAEMYDRIKERAEVSNFGSVEEYVAFVLSEVLKEEADEEVTLDRGQEEEVKKRLRALGYMD
jgi:Arc/MetJ-type ribon-helix-helix transcriptional regulator